MNVEGRQVISDWSSAPTSTCNSSVGGGDEHSKKNCRDSLLATAPIGGHRVAGAASAVFSKRNSSCWPLKVTLQSNMYLFLKLGNPNTISLRLEVNVLSIKPLKYIGTDIESQYPIVNRFSKFITLKLQYP